MNESTYQKMNRKYSGLYEYGATANFSKDKSVNRAINEVRYQNLKGFLKDNLDLVKPEKDIHCQRHLLAGGQWSCYAQARNNKRCIEFRDYNGYLFDHPQAFRVKRLRRSLILVTHSYHDGVDYPVKELRECLLEGLKAVVYPSEKSWYYPDRTCLIFITRPELLDMLSLDGFGEPIVTFAGEMGDPHSVLPQF